MRKITTKDKSLEVTLFNDGMVEIEAYKLKNVCIEIKKANITNPLTPPNALYRISIYQSEKKAKDKPFEYDTAWVMADGTILKRGQEYNKYMGKHQD
jgi:hypothetical protein